MHRRAVDCAAKQFHVLDQTMSIIQEQRSKHFVIEGTELEAEELTCSARGSKDGSSDTKALRNKRFGTIEHILGSGLSKLVAVANVQCCYVRILDFLSGEY
jgi:hypothetical protein